MQFTEIDAYPLRPGELRNWVPTTGPAAQWRDDPRATSHVHEAHLRGAEAVLRRRHIDGGRESWLGLGVEFDEPLSIPGLRTALRAWIDRHEVLRTHVFLEDGAPRRRSAQIDTVDLKVQTVGTYNSTEPLAEQLLGEFDRATAPLTWPAYMFSTVAREDSFTLFFAADHSLLDGYSLILSPYELRELYRQAVHGDEPKLIPAGSYVNYSDTDRQSADRATAAHPAAMLWDEYLTETGYQPSPFPMPLLPPSAKVLADETLAALTLDPDGVPRMPQNALNFHLLDDERANNFTRVCSEAGASLVTGVLACMAKINTDLGFGPIFRCAVTRHTRDAEQWIAALGWFVGIAPFRLDTTGARTFGELAQRAQEQWRHSKTGSTLPYLRIGEVLAQEPGHAQAPPPRFVVSFMDTRSAPGSAINDAGGASALRSRDYSLDDVYLWMLRTPSGLHVAARFPGFDTARRSLTLYLGALRSMLTEIGDATVTRG
ncbi:Condensation domain protein OS=Tsukamurella paurometabola (strain ATCC 8368 / DSM / CCUG 35730/ CIP 100753 / JCM 10117 / KCTC 9821 / NBRC 16120 / NCIMB 702349 / NCTC 13040) OX=521096 GN=Tpau_1032 PE=4 SV=1 [Tsukamurella paurometabola]|uniref:Condensation domain protein n=1 Tax=Tsukamurella paurometabola (strain ATCC 8368 / DSM 20162 / CCUG 35730 / CIP 100753 / JCM 10117 / KCTC 9821 / NBRC 16120 / NCIMB 702349 / NCTC 13040) TaxID=521096 RepID=D5UV75_TSUPD|nr:condensation domain-containing protein [Tsukamurella paurometabola]ADG77665.1 condensation domain protein [Tsukamurella paurometabola DSM 20162]SUP28201.1 Trehalose-2-sulfate acyltransferase papA2 [Tsukamurella paurometabola]